MIKTGIIYILFCTCNLILGYTEGGAAWWVDYRKDACECRSLCECPGATLDQALTEVCLPSLRWAPPTATPGALRVLFAHRRKPLRLHRILTAQDLRPTRGAVEGSSGTSALGNEAEQAQDHRARTEDSGLPPHQHVWWGSWHLKGCQRQSARHDVNWSSESCGFRKEGDLFSRAQVWGGSRNIIVSSLWGFSSWGWGWSSWLWVTAAVPPLPHFYSSHMVHWRSGQENGGWPHTVG